MFLGRGDTSSLKMNTESIASAFNRLLSPEIKDNEHKIAYKVQYLHTQFFGTVIKHLKIVTHFFLLYNWPGDKFT